MKVYLLFSWLVMSAASSGLTYALLCVLDEAEGVRRHPVMIRWRRMAAYFAAIVPFLAMAAGMGFAA